MKSFSQGSAVLVPREEVYQDLIATQYPYSLVKAPHSWGVREYSTKGLYQDHIPLFLPKNQ